MGTVEQLPKALELSGLVEVDLQMEADVFGPSKCMNLFASANILPKEFHMAHGMEEDVKIFMSFDANTNRKTLRHMLAKLEVMPVTISIHHNLY